jgi:hypothetical protein
VAGLKDCYRISHTYFYGKVDVKGRLGFVALPCGYSWSFSYHLDGVWKILGAIVQSELYLIRVST